MRTFGLILLILGLCSPAWAAEGTPTDLAQKAAAARAAYDASDYTQARTLYLELQAAGFSSAELYFNLGNAEFKSGRLGRAIGYYRRAAQVSPGDTDIRYNLNFARTLVKRPTEKTGALTRLAKRFFQALPGRTLALAAWVAYMILALVAGWLIVRHGQGQILRWAAVLSGALFVLLAAWASVRILADRNMQWGVIIVNQAEARNGPSSDYEVGFKVPVGREVRVLGQEGSWIAIGLTPEGYKGFIQESEIWPDEP